MFGWLSAKNKTQISRDPQACIDRAIQWVKANHLPNGGILPHHKEKIATQEVTGYLIPTLYTYGEKKLAIDLARWEASVQRPDGAFTDIYDKPYTFDSAQVVRGFLSVLHEVPELEQNLRRVCDWMLTQISPNGKVNTPDLATWAMPDGSVITDNVHVYVLTPLLDAGKRLNEKKYIEAAQKSQAYYRQQPGIATFNVLSHFFGYIMEALVDLGEKELARKGLEEALRFQDNDGSIPAFPGAKWVCSTGLAQVAIAWQKMGMKEPAEKALRYLQKIQNPSGGFYGGYGDDAYYFPKEEISWAVKYFLDLNYLLKK